MPENSDEVLSTPICSRVHPRIPIYSDDEVNSNCEIIIIMKIIHPAKSLIPLPDSAFQFPPEEK